MLHNRIVSYENKGVEECREGGVGLDMKVGYCML
jgi:hypothetical protein